MRKESRARMLSRPVLLTVALFLASLWLFSHPVFDKTSRHRMTLVDLGLDLPRLDFSPDRDHSSWYNSEEAKAFCHGHDYSVFRPRSSTGERKVYDLFMANAELDLLEIRLSTLYDFVDYFIVIESPKTFQGTDKSPSVRDNWMRFRPYHDKMIYHELDLPGDWAPPSAGHFEDFQRNAMYDQVFPRLEGSQRPTQGDVIIVSDVDEIPRPVTTLLLRTCDFPRRLTLASKFYWYSFQFLHADGEWMHPQATYYDGSSTIRPSDLRRGTGGMPGLRDLEKGIIPNSAWHCSGCFPTLQGFLDWMASSSLPWVNQEQYRSREKISNAVREGRDLWGREHDRLVRIEGNQDIPPILRLDRDTYRYLLDRDGETAGFSDYP